MRKIVVWGAVNVVFFRSPSAHLVVAGENQEAIHSTKTYFEGDKLIIEQECVSINVNGGNIQIISGDNIVISGSGGRFNVSGRGSNISIGSGRSIVGIALPEAPSIRIKGSAT